MHSMARRFALALLLTLLIPAATAFAQAGANKPGEDGWQAVQTQMVQPGESFQATDLVGAAYGFIWVMVAGFTFTVWRRAGRLEKEIEALRAQVKEKGGR